MKIRENYYINNFDCVNEKNAYLSDEDLKDYRQIKDRKSVV